MKRGETHSFWLTAGFSSTSNSRPSVADDPGKSPSTSIGDVPSLLAGSGSTFIVGVDIGANWDDDGVEGCERGPSVGRAVDELPTSRFLGLGWTRE